MKQNLFKVEYRKNGYVDDDTRPILHSTLVWATSEGMAATAGFFEFGFDADDMEVTSYPSVIRELDTPLPGSSFEVIEEG